MPPKDSPILKIRTFADDLKRAQGAPVVERSLESTTLPTPVSSTPSEPQPSVSPAQKEINASLARTVQRSPAPKTLTHRDSAFDIRDESASNESISEATIIDDRKVSEWSLFSEMQKGLQTWWETEVAPLFEKKREHFIQLDVAPQVEEKVFTPTSPEPQHIPQVRTLAQDAQEVESGRRSPLPTPQPTSWRRISEPREALPLPNATKEEVREHRAEMQKALPPLPPTQKQPFKELRPPRMPLPAFRTESVISKDVASAVAPTSDPSERLKRLAPNPPQQPEERIVRDIPFIPPSFTHQTSAPIRTYRYDALSDIKHRELSKTKIAVAELARTSADHPPMQRDIAREPSRIVPVLGTILAVTFIGLLGTYGWEQWSAREPVTLVAGIPSFFTADQQKILSLSGDRSTILERLNAERLALSLAPNETVHFALQKDASGTTTTATAEEVFMALDVRIPGAFTRSLTDTLMLGATSDKAPYIILKTTNAETAFAGMLAWEEYMSADLSPLFGGAVRRSYDPAALTSDHTRDAYFADVVIQNKDVRILYDEYGAERLLYSFIDPHTIVLTASSDALQTLMQKLR